MVAIEGAHTRFKIQVQEWKNLLIRGNDPASFDKYLAQFSDEEKKVQSLLEISIAKMKDRGITTDEVEKIKASHTQMGTKYREALKSFDKADANTGKTVDKLVKGMDRATSDGMEKIVTQIEKQLAERHLARIANTESSNVSARNLFAVLTSLGLVISVGLSLAIRHDIIRQLGGDPAYAAEITQRIAKGDLRTTVQTKTGDNSSLLVQMRQMQESLRDVIGKIREAANRLRTDAELLAVTSKQVSNGSVEQSAAATSTAAAIEEMTVSIQHIASSSDAAKKVAEIAGQQSREGEGAVQEAVAEINQIATSFNHSSQLISNLSDQSGQISAIVHVIKEIADQTNLLALNAAIEAARAGEQGRGFAVVADEVRKLAERTTASTQEIASMIQSIQQSTDNAMQGMTDGGSRLDEGVRLAAKAGVSMTDIEASSRQVLASVAEIAEALHEQQSNSGLIAQNVEKIAQMTEENSAAVSRVDSAAANLDGLAGSLTSLVGHFKI